MEKYFVEPGHLAWSLRGKLWKPSPNNQSHDYITPTQIFGTQIVQLHTELLYSHQIFQILQRVRLFEEPMDAIRNLHKS
jgi:hypothetical protein